jgi:tetratricopeptide (TPR) repeat protein
LKSIADKIQIIFFISTSELEVQQLIMSIFPLQDGTIDQQKLWMSLSEMVQVARRDRNFEETNKALRYYGETQEDAGLACAALLWLADNLVIEMRYEEAIYTHQEIVQKYPGLTFTGKEDGQHWAAHALEQVATCHERLGNLEEALFSYQQILQSFPQGMSQAWLHYRMGQIFESGYRDGEAVQAYRTAASLSVEAANADWATPELARHNADHLEFGAKLTAQPDQLGKTIAYALMRQDANTLSTLASPTHFCIGIACSELEFVDPNLILKYLLNDLSQSKIRVDPYHFEGEGGKLYLMTEGWNGRLLKGQVAFLLIRHRDGWQWGGLVLTQPGEAWKELFPPPPPAQNQPLEIGIKSPFQRGENWRAGGLNRFLLSFAPFIGPFIVLEDNFSGCGFGPGGFYYNQGSTHQGMDAFSIDFTRYVPGLPLFSDQHRKPVLSVQDGVVVFVRNHVPTHATFDDNRVEIQHPGLADLFAPLITGRPLSQPFKYTSKYLHLDGPFLIPVSIGMFVRQGARLGVTDDTGFSAFSHLHFSLHDRDRGGATLRPTPMDGQRLGDGDGGKCIGSTNVPFP